MKTIQWEISDIGGGSDTIVTKASRKMLQGEQIITKWAPALLQMTLDDLLWKDSNDISIKKLWEYLSTYCYLPRLSNFSVLEEAICQGFIEMFDYGILQDAGKVSAEIAKLHAETEFEKYRVIQDRLFMSGFDRYMLELEENTKK